MSDELSKDLFTQEIDELSMIIKSNLDNHMGSARLELEFIEMLLNVDDNGDFVCSLLKNSRAFAVSALLSIARKYRDTNNAGRYNEILCEYYLKMADRNQEIEPDELWKIFQVLAFTEDRKRFPFLLKMFENKTMDACLDYHPRRYPNYEVLDNFIRVAYRQEDKRMCDLLLKFLQDTRLHNHLRHIGTERLTLLADLTGYWSPNIIEFALNFVLINFVFSNECVGKSCHSQNKLCNLSSEDCGHFQSLSRIVTYLAKTSPGSLQSAVVGGNVNPFLQKLALMALSKNGAV